MSKTQSRAQPAVLESWEVTWWQIDDGLLVLHSQRFDMPGDARVLFAQLDASTSPGLIKHYWNLRNGRWDQRDMVGQAVTPERARDVNARGFKAVHALIAHARGHDSRGVLEPLDEFLAADGKDRPVTDPLVGSTAADCTVCDYLCQHGLVVDDAHVAPILVQPTLEYRDITETERPF